MIIIIYSPCIILNKIIKHIEPPFKNELIGEYFDRHKGRVFQDNNGIYGEKGLWYIDDARVNTQRRPVNPARCYKFDGINDYISTNLKLPFINTTNKFKIECYISFSDVQSTTSINTIISNTWNTGNGFRTSFSNSYESDLPKRRYISIILYRNGIPHSNRSIGDVITDNNYHLVEFVGDGENIKLFVDKVDVTDLDDRQYPLLETVIVANTTIGLGNGNLHYHNGGLSYMKIYDNNDKLVLFYKCDEGSGNIAYDSSGKGNHGTITNATLPTFHSVNNTGTLPSFRNKDGYSFIKHFTFNDQTDFILTNHNFQFEIDFIFYSSTNSQVLVNKQESVNVDLRSYILYITNQHKIIFNCSPDGINAYNRTHNTTLIEGVNYKVIITKTNSTYSFSLNGSTSNTVSGTAPSTLFNTPSPFMIGNSPTNLAHIKSKIESIKFTKNGVLISHWSIVNGNFVDLLNKNNPIPNDTPFVIPRNESNVKLDIFDFDLKYKLPAKFPMQIIGQTVGNFNGVNYLKSSNFLFNKNIESYYQKIIFETRSFQNTFVGLSSIDKLSGVGYDYFCTLLIYNDNTLRFRIKGSLNLVDIFSIPLNQNTYYVCEIIKTNQSNNIKIILNNVEYNNNWIVGFDCYAENTSIAIGTYYTTTRLFNGKIHYSKVVINNNYLYEYGFSEGAGSTVYDISGNNHHGTWLNHTSPTQWSTSNFAEPKNMLYGFNTNNGVKLPAKNRDVDVFNNPLQQKGFIHHRGFNNSEVKLKPNPFNANEIIKAKGWNHTVELGYGDIVESNPFFVDYSKENIKNNFLLYDNKKYLPKLNVLRNYSKLNYFNIPTNNLELFLPFTETTNDYSGNNNNITVNGGKLIKDKENKTNSAYYLTFNNFISIENVGDFERTDSFSVSCFIKLDVIPTNFHIFIGKEKSPTSNNRGWALRNGSVDRTKLRVQINNTSSTNSIAIESTLSNLLSTNWTHIGFTYNASSNANGVKLYLNGNLISSTIITNNLTGTIKNDIPLSIGPRIEDLLGGFNGSIDNVRIYNRLLTNEEMFILYNE